MAERRADIDWSHSNQRSSNAQELAGSLDNIDSDGSGQNGTIRSWADVDLHRLANSIAQGSGLAALRALNAQMYAGTNEGQPGVVASHDRSLPSWTGAAPSASEAGVPTASTTFEPAAEHHNTPSEFEQFSAPNASWSGPSLDLRQLRRVRVDPIPIMEAQAPPPNFFATPDRGTHVASTGPPLYRNTPTTSGRKRKADTDGLQLPLPGKPPAAQLATPTKGPLTAGAFGSQARSLRGGRQRSVQIDQFPLPPQELFAQLQEIPQLLSGGMSDLTQMVTHLARKHRALEQRVLRLEHENRALKGQQPSPSDQTPIQQDAKITIDEAMQAQQPASEYVYTELDPPPRKKKRSKKAVPMAGGPYGGPLYTQPAKTPGMLSGMFANNRQTAVPVQRPPPSMPSPKDYGPATAAARDVLARRPDVVHGTFANNRQDDVPAQSAALPSEAPRVDEYPLPEETDAEARDYYDFD